MWYNVHICVFQHSKNIKKGVGGWGVVVICWVNPKQFFNSQWLVTNVLTQKSWETGLHFAKPVVWSCFLQITRALHWCTELWSVPFTPCSWWKQVGGSQGLNSTESKVQNRSSDLYTKQCAMAKFLLYTSPMAVLARHSVCDGRTQCAVIVSVLCFNAL